MRGNDSYYVSFEIFSLKNHTRKWLSEFKSKAKKSVRVHAPHETVLPIPIAPAIALPIRSNSPVSPTPCIQASLTATSVNDVKIDDLCKTVFNCSGASNCYLGYLSDEHQNHHEIRCHDDNLASHHFQEGPFVSLETILSNTKPFPPLNRHERYKIASILASSLLQLQNAPWLARNLQKDNILFPCDWNAHRIMIDQPHLPHSFHSTKLQPMPPEIIPKPNSTATVKKSLSDLGIILLELCFGQRIEEQPIRQSYLVDGKAHDSTNYLTALEWADAVCGQEPALEPVIKCCMFCIFEEKANWDDLKFTQAVYASVVEPLEKIVSSWPNAS